MASQGLWLPAVDSSPGSGFRVKGAGSVQGDGTGSLDTRKCLELWALSRVANHSSYKMAAKEGFRLNKIKELFSPHAA